MFARLSSLLPSVYMCDLLSAPQATGADIPHSRFPHSKAVPAGLTPEGINRGQTEHPFPEPAAGSRRPFRTTLRAGGLSHGCAPLLPSVTRSYTAIATTDPVKNPTDNTTTVTSTHILHSFAVLHHPMTRKEHPRLGIQQCNCITGGFSLLAG